MGAEQGATATVSCVTSSSRRGRDPSGGGPPTRTPLRPPDLAHNAEVDEAHPPVGQDQQVACESRCIQSVHLLIHVEYCH